MRTRSVCSFVMMSLLTPAGIITTVVSPDAGLNLPNHIAIDSSGTLFVTDAGSSRVVRVNTDGSVQEWGICVEGYNDNGATATWMREKWWCASSL